MTVPGTPMQVVAIGDELLRGETEDANSGWIARRLTERGLGLDRICVVSDDRGRIAAEIRDGVNFLTGGLGPTPDDVTRSSVAAALDLPLEENREALEFIEGRSDTPEHRRMAALPEGSAVLRNGVGIAPGFVVESGDVTVAALPGPPREMRSVFQRAAEELGLQGEPPHVEEVTVPGREGDIVPLIDELFDRFPGLEIGSYPGKDGVRIRMAGDPDRVEEATDLVRRET